jgi:hypothetical protein
MPYKRLVSCVVLLGVPVAIAASTRTITTDAGCSYVEIVRILAWPITALILLVAFQEPLTAFLNGLGRRITKLSLFKVELELQPAKPAASLPLFDEIRTAANAATINDSSRMMLVQVQSGEPADYAEISLGNGTEWLTSRLYIAAVMMERMRGLKCLVFVDRASATERRFVAIAQVSQLRWALAQRYPWLEAAWLQSIPVAVPLVATDPKTMLATSQIVRSGAGAFDPQEARTLVGNFIGALQVTGALPAGAATNEWTGLRDGTWERAEWINRELLATLLPPQTFRAHANDQPATSQPERTRAVLRCHAPYIALIDNEHEFEVIRHQPRSVAGRGCNQPRRTARSGIG